jgi:hypothetical protein
MFSGSEESGCASACHALTLTEWTTHARARTAGARIRQSRRRSAFAPFTRSALPSADLLGTPVRGGGLLCRRRALTDHAWPATCGRKPAPYGSFSRSVAPRKPSGDRDAPVTDFAINRSIEEVLMTAATLVSTSRHVLQLLFALFLGLATNAQDPGGGAEQPEPGLEGGWDVKNQDGEEVAPGVEADVYIVENPNGSYTGHVFITRGGNPPAWLPGETLTIYPVLPGRYVWENAQGGSGIIVWNPAGHYDSLVTGGPNTGTRRIFESH